MKYLIIYSGNIRQVKNLIDHNIHEEGKRIGNRLIPEGLNNKEIKEFYKETERLKKEFLAPYEPYFTDRSPLYYAMATGILDCNNQKIEVEFERF